MFAIGDRKWPGISKLVEECGEVLQICGKLFQTRGETNHWNVPDLKVALEDEIADVIAAAHFVIDVCGLNFERIMARKAMKYAKFMQWHEGENDPR